MTQKRKLKFKRFKFKKQGKGLWKQILGIIGSRHDRRGVGRFGRLLNLPLKR